MIIYKLHGILQHQPQQWTMRLAAIGVPRQAPRWTSARPSSPTANATSAVAVVQREQMLYERIYIYVYVSTCTVAFQ